MGFVIYVRVYLWVYIYLRKYFSVFSVHRLHIQFIVFICVYVYGIYAEDNLESLFPSSGN